ncbi:MAG: Fe-S-containing protein [Oscillospiraceae bacterium]|nr:Fe-S-containing protein [Oscillospiraceae bacterium]
MLKYFVMTCEALMISAILTGACTGYAEQRYPKTGKITLFVGTVLGILGAAVMAYLKNATKLIDTSLWNMRNFIAAAVVLVVFFLVSALQKPMKCVGDFLPPILLCLLPALVIFYALPDVLAYPYVILLTEKTVLSTNFLLKTVGILFGLAMMVLIAAAVRRGMRRLPKPSDFLMLTLLLLVHTARQISVVLRIMLTKRMISSNHTLFSIAKFSSNHDNWFTFAVIGIAAVIPLILLVKYAKITELYHNPAEHRKLRKAQRMTRTWAGVILCCMVFSVLNLTSIKTYANRAVELSPVEDSVIQDGNVVVRFEQVEDGHLHRFAYVSENGVQIRFIVIKKPNSSAYGIGLDACDICGETGYYEKDGQVVCNLCDVVMNINTIGFKGGCNPIVIPYTIENGSIYVPIEGLLAYEKEFK